MFASILAAHSREHDLQDRSSVCDVIIHPHPKQYLQFGFSDNYSEVWLQDGVPPKPLDFHSPLDDFDQQVYGCIRRLRRIAFVEDDILAQIDAVGPMARHKLARQVGPVLTVVEPRAFARSPVICVLKLQ